MIYRYEGGWQDRTIRRLCALELNFACWFGKWFALDSNTPVGGPFATPAEFDVWLDDRERMS